MFDGKNYDVVIQKLEEVWAMDGTDAEAAYYAGIKQSTLCEFLKRTPAVLERKHELKNRPVLKARTTIYKDLDNTDTAKWYMERKMKGEFSSRSEVGVDAKVEVKDRPTKEMPRQKLMDYLERLSKGQ